MDSKENSPSIKIISNINLLISVFFAILGFANLIQALKTFNILISIVLIIVGMLLTSTWKRDFLNKKPWTYYLDIILISSIFLYLLEKTEFPIIQKILFLLITLSTFLFLALNKKIVYHFFPLNNSLKENINNFKNFLKEDNWQSWLLTLYIVIIGITLVLFPILNIVTGSPLPIVIVESCSMYHSLSFNEWWSIKGEEYSEFNISKEEFSSFKLKNGLNKGDIMIILSTKEYKKGDVIIFSSNKESNHKNPVIHRIVSESIISTKGDNNEFQLKLNNNPSNIDETSISKEQILGKAVFKIPYLGWIKLIFFELSRPKEQRGLCS